MCIRMNSILLTVDYFSNEFASPSLRWRILFTPDF